MKQPRTQRRTASLAHTRADRSNRSGVIPEDYKTAGFALGCQAWTFKKFSLLEAIWQTSEAGVKVIELYPGQRFSAAKPDIKFDHQVGKDIIAAVDTELKKSGVRAVNYGVVKIPEDEDGAREIFEFAKELRLYAITTESIEAIDVIEKLAKEYDLRVGFHNHPRLPLNPFYKNWDPNHVLSVVQDRDRRLGAAADTGHWLRSGLDPLNCLKILDGRIVSVHLKDLNRKSLVAQDVPFGTGIAGIAAILSELKRQRFEGNVSIEYERHWKNNLDEVARCVRFVRDGETEPPSN